MSTPAAAPIRLENLPESMQGESRTVIQVMMPKELKP